MKYYSHSCLLTLLVSGCATVAPVKITLENSKVNSSNRETVLNRDINQCRQEALTRIKVSSAEVPNYKFMKVNYFNPGSRSRTNQPASIGEAFSRGLRDGQRRRALNSRPNNYNRALAAYVKSCMQLRGWKEVRTK